MRAPPGRRQLRKPWSGHRLAREAHRAQGRRKRRETLLTIGREIDAFVVHEALSGLHADATLAHVFLDDRWRGVAAVAERLDEVAAGVVQDVAAAPVDELEKTEDRETESESVEDRLVDVFGRCDPLFHHASSLVHGERLDSRNDVA